MIVIDFETRSEADLTKTGPWAYAEDPTTDILCMSYKVNGDPVRTWRAYEDELFPVDLRRLIEQGELMEAHNVAFEISIWENLRQRYGMPEVQLSQWRDLMAVACYYSLPAPLDKLARVLGFGGKDPEGGRLISKYSKLHLKTAKYDIPAEDYEKFVSYCKDDVRLEYEIGEILGDLPEPEEEIFLHDLEMNMRGLRLDGHGIEIATEVVHKRSKELSERFIEITGYKPTQRDRVLEWFQQYLPDLDNLRAETIDELLAEDEEYDRFNNMPEVREALTLRRKHSKASTKKLDAMLRQQGEDGRARWQIRYHGAITGRNTGSGFQPLNLNRGFEKVKPEQLVKDIVDVRNPRWLDFMYGDAMDAIGKASRHWIMADRGHRILAADYVSIEAVVNACLAGETWKIEAFRNKEGIYERTAEKIYKLPKGTVTKATHPQERFDGKTGELAFGYQGAVGAWRKFDSSDRHTDENVVSICKQWREENSMIVRQWREYESAAIEAVTYPGRVTGYRYIGFEIVDQWLTMILPNGKRIWYFSPRVSMAMPHWHQPEEKEKCALGTCDCEEVPKLSYMAYKEGQWRPTYTYGGKLTENACQATSREILKPAEMAANKVGYKTILSVYDEVVSEVKNGFGSLNDFMDIMRDASHHEWASDWPIQVDGWEGIRYRK